MKTNLMKIVSLDNVKIQTNLHNPMPINSKIKTYDFLIESVSSM